MKPYRNISGPLLLALCAGLVAYGPATLLIDHDQLSNIASADMNAVTKDWDPEALKQNAHPILLTRIRRTEKTVENLESYLKKCKDKLGAQKDLHCSLLKVGKMGPPRNAYKIADYTCDGDFEKGKATIRTVLRQDKAGDPWKVMAFRVNSSQFVDLQKQE